MIDSDELEAGSRREGAVGLALFVGMHGLAVVGYVPNEEQPERVVLGIKVLYCIVRIAMRQETSAVGRPVDPLGRYPRGLCQPRHRWAATSAPDRPLPL